MCLCLAPASYSFELDAVVVEFVRDRFGDPAANRLRDWENLTNQRAQAEELEKLRIVNSFFNQTRFLSDQEHWRQEDYWATPVELLATNAGDCEDYSIAKYFTLKEMGVPIDKLKITYVKALELNQAHMVLAYYETPDADPLILDNLINDIKRGSERTDLWPVYSFNGEGLWLAKYKEERNKLIGTPDRLDNWLDLMDRQTKLME